MDQTTARRTARVLNEAGFRVVADNCGGWSGGPMSQRWGVRPAFDDGMSGVCETEEQMPDDWRETLADAQQEA